MLRFSLLDFIAEFAVHLDRVRDGTAPADYQKPALFLDRTFLTQNLIGLAGKESYDPRKPATFSRVVLWRAGHPDLFSLGRLVIT